VVTGAVVSDVGCLRDNNEDNFILGKHINANCGNFSEALMERNEDPWVFAGVFDGMGGGEKGEIAAQCAAQAFRNAAAQISDDASCNDVDAVLRKAFLEANNKIIDMQDNRVYGTTGTVVATNSTSYKIYHLGDSRAYLFRDGQLVPLTRDQTLAQMKIDVGLYLPDDPQAEAEKHKLTEYIGKDPTKKHLRPVESEWIPRNCRALLLLCSDGLYDMCTDQEILEILSRESDILGKAKALVAAALDNGGIDNVTCVLLECSANS
jgi:protein phosphatase